MGVDVNTTHRRGQLPGVRRWLPIVMGVLVILVAAYTLVDYYRFTQCQASVNEQAARVDEVRGEAFGRSIDAQIRVAETLLNPQGTTPGQSRDALEEYRNSLLEQRQVRDAFERPAPEHCR